MELSSYSSGSRKSKWVGRAMLFWRFLGRIYFLAFSNFPEAFSQFLVQGLTSHLPLSLPDPPQSLSYGPRDYIVPPGSSKIIYVKILNYHICKIPLAMSCNMFTDWGNLMWTSLMGPVFSWKLISKVNYIHILPLSNIRTLVVSFIYSHFKATNLPYWYFRIPPIFFKFLLT